jgi:hypothetical protein
MGMRRAQDRRMQCVRPNREIVAKAPMASQQVGVLEAADRTSGIGRLVRPAVPVAGVARHVVDPDVIFREIPACASGERPRRPRGNRRSCAACRSTGLRARSPATGRHPRCRSSAFSRCAAPTAESRAALRPAHRSPLQVRHRRRSQQMDRRFDGEYSDRATCGPHPFALANVRTWVGDLR